MSDLLYVCSPYRGDTKRNKEYARKLTRAAINNGFVPVTVHLYLTEVTDDQNPEERSRGMAAGMKILENCKYILIGNKYGVSDGMKAEMTLAALKGKVMLYEQDGTVNISARSMGAINVQLILEGMGGGGHQTMAGAQIKDITLEDCRQQLLVAIDRYYEENPKGGKDA